MEKSETRSLVASVREADGAELIAANLASVALHADWVVPPRDAATFLAYVRGCDGERRVGLIARERATGRIVGVINLSDIVRGALQGAYLGYYAVAGGTGRGLMTEALSLAIGRAFGELGLHRLEANIQPGNRPPWRSRAASAFGAKVLAALPQHRRAVARPRALGAALGRVGTPPPW